MTILDAFYSLGSGINKFRGKENQQETEEGVVSEQNQELTVKLKNDDILALTRKWIKTWDESEVKNDWLEQSKVNEEYWRGKQHDMPKASQKRPLVDNVIFESLETYLPQVTRRNPDPMVMLSRKEQQTAENLAFASNLQKELGEIADEQVLRLKLKKLARHWAIYLLGAIVPGWDIEKDMPTANVVRPQKLILDPTATVDEDGYTGDYFGRYEELPASQILEILEEANAQEGAMKKIKELAKDKDGNEALATEIRFIEWWTKDYMCWTIGWEQVLLKEKFLHWNYEIEEEVEYGEDDELELDQETGEIIPKMKTVQPDNHFENRRLPIVLLSVFNLGKQPIDETSLIGQNLSNQDLINKRNRQIDKNADSMNGGMVVSLERSGLTKDQAKGVTEALRRGGTITIPTGSVQEAITRMSASSLPGDVYNQLVDTRTRVRDIFGTRGSSAAGLSSEDTVRGKIQNRMLDTDRIGGGVSEYLEQIADQIYNWYVQLLYVYDDRYIMGPKPKVRISVKEGSLLPKDSLTMANQAIELAGQNRMSLLDLYKALDYPNPEEMAANVWLEANAPDMLLSGDERIKQVMQRMAESKQGSEEENLPSRSISFKDLPPDGQAQLAAQAGIQLNPKGIAAYNKNEKMNELTIEEPNQNNLINL
jgi:hypothetical protein